MLVDFTVGNYRSIRDPVTLSAIEAARGPGRSRQGTGKRRSIKRDDEIAPAFPVPGRKFALLPVLGIFGANASGKTNVLRALDDLLWLMTHAGPPSEHLLPFELDRRFTAAPTEFHLRVALNGAVYTYCLEVDRRRVYRETLDYLPGGADDPILVFGGEVGTHTEGRTWTPGEALAPLVQMPPQLPDDQTLMALLATYERHPTIGPLAIWLKRSVRGISLGYEGLERKIADYWMHEQELARRAFEGFLKTADLSIVRLEARRKPGQKNEYDVTVYHETPQGIVPMPLERESLGTQRLFELAPKLVWGLEYGSLALFDELGATVHPHRAERIVRLFQDPNTNPKRAQIIFTSHDNTLLQSQLLRRDQVWFTEKRPDGSTDLYSVSDFRARNDLALDRAYLDGRFGAVPVLFPREEEVAAAGLKG